MPIAPIAVDGGKYTFQTAPNGYSVEVLRHGEPWLIIDQGCNAVHALMYEVERLREEVARLVPIAEAGNDPSGRGGL